MSATAFARLLINEPPALDQASQYQIGPENVLQIDVYYGKNEQLSQKVRVSARGVINFPLVGELSVAGLTVSQLQEKLKGLLEKDYLVNPQVTVFIEEYSTVSIMGEVKIPGAYPIKGQLTVVGLISLAGGFSESASPNEVKVIRTAPDGTTQESIVRVQDKMERNAGESESFLLRSGDVVNVPKSTVTIMGEVKSPGVFPTKGRLNIIELISLAGGFDENASPNEVKVIRILPDGTKQENIVRVKDIMDKNAEDEESLILQGGDLVIVPESMVTIMGEVEKPGAYATRGRLTVIELIGLAGGFTRIAAPNKVKVIHTNFDGTKEESIVRVKDIMNQSSGDNNEGLVLRAGDVVIVPESLF